VTPTPGAPQGGITEADLAQYLANNPAFFERHAELLASVQLTSPHGQRAVSLQERQMEMLRERIKGLERHRRPSAPLDARGADHPRRRRAARRGGRRPEA
jgi:Protein of unknown function, DUF484